MVRVYREVYRSEIKTAAVSRKRGSRRGVAGEPKGRCSVLSGYREPKGCGRRRPEVLRFVGLQGTEGEAG
ncbi:hypothetical protein HanPSC8_Chr01g0003781 [Helianthus annuus]|nr:hypothetical protein HanPSC8_Chr01g0003781 [Helianthus annuus]